MKALKCLLASVLLLPCVAVCADKVDREGKAWLEQNSEPAEINVDGIWNSRDWGKVQLIQAQGSREVTGRGDSWTINGVVSGKKVCLLFSDKGNIAYSAELTGTVADTLTGSYANGLMKAKSKTRPMTLKK